MRFANVFRIILSHALCSSRQHGCDLSEMRWKVVAVPSVLRWKAAAAAIIAELSDVLCVCTLFLL